MKLLGILFVFAGYVLVYAATAAGGKFATDPWASLFADAYTDAGGQGAPLPTTGTIAPGVVSSYPPSTVPTTGTTAQRLAAIAQRRHIPLKNP